MKLPHACGMHASVSSCISTNLLIVIIITTVLTAELQLTPETDKNDISSSTVNVFTDDQLLSHGVGSNDLVKVC